MNVNYELADAVNRLFELLEGHDDECINRCLREDCTAMHGCDLCEEEEAAE